MSFVDYDSQRCTRRCAATDRPLEPGEVFHSVLKMVDGELLRTDYSAEGWAGNPNSGDEKEEGVLAVWKSQMPTTQSLRAKMTPNEVLLSVLEELESQPSQADYRYVLALLLMRRRVLVDEGTQEIDGQTCLTYSCTRNDKTYYITDAVPSAERFKAIQDDLVKLLLGGQEGQ